MNSKDVVVSQKWISKIFSFPRLSIQKVAILGVILGLQLILARFVKFNLGPVQVSLNYAFWITYGISLELLPALILAIVSDTLVLVINGSIGTWMWEYSIIPVFIVVVSFILKSFVFNKSGKNWLITTLLVSIVVDLIALSILIINNVYDLYDFKQKVSTSIVVWIGFAFLVSIQAFLFTMYLKKKTNQLKTIINISVLVLLVSVITTWLWGPIAFIRYMNHMSIGNYSMKNNYGLLLIPRIIKTAPESFVWTLLASAIYGTVATNWSSLTKDRWGN